MKPQPGGFAGMPDADLVAYAESHREFAAGAAIEMQRRLVVAIRDFNQQSGQQTTDVIGLTDRLRTLTVWLIALAITQILVGIGQILAAIFH